MGYPAKHSQQHATRPGAARPDAALETDWIDISALPVADRRRLWRHLQIHHPSLALLLGDAQLKGFAWVPGAEIWIERRCVPGPLADGR